MPTSVLLAVLAAAGLLALAPALTRRYDATERVAAERATSTARVLSRRRRRRTVPGRYPINAPRFMGMWRGHADQRAASARSGAAGAGSGAARARSGAAGRHGSRSATAGKDSGRADPVRTGTGSSPRSGKGRVGSARTAAGSSRSRSGPRRRRPVPTALHRRRRVLLALVLLNAVELAGVALVGSGFWIGFSVSFTVLLADLVYLRRRALTAARLRRVQRRRMAWVAAEQAAVRREHARRAAERHVESRRAAVDRTEARRDAVRQASDYVERYTPRRTS